MTHGEEDFTKRMKGVIDLWYIKGIELLDPTVEACLPVSIETPAIAYDSENDRFKVDIEALSVGTIETTITNLWERELGQVDLARYAGDAVGVTNPLHAQIVVSGAVVDPRAIRTISYLTDTIKVYGNASSLVQDGSGSPYPLYTEPMGKDKTNFYYHPLATTLAGAGTVATLLAQLEHDGVEIDPRNRNWALDDGDVPDLLDRAARLLGKVYGSEDVLQQRATSKELLVQIQHQGSEKDPTQIRALTSSDVVTVADIAKTGTVKQISNTFAVAGEYKFWDPVAGKKVRLKFLSLELSADVTLSLRLATGGTDYYLRTSAGPYVANLVGANLEAAADADIYLYASAACTVKGFAIGEEV